MAAAVANAGPSTSTLDESRYADIDTVLDRRGPWTAEEFVGGQQVSLAEVDYRMCDKAKLLGQRCVEEDGQGAGHWCWWAWMRDSTKPCAQ